MDRIELLKTFVTVTTEGGFSKAADKLNISSQLVSKYIAQLEQQLNVRLFNRTTRKVHLTEAGEQCFEHATQILENMANMEGHFGQLQKEAQGLLRISAPVSFATLHLAPLLCQFKKRYPAISIDLKLNDRKVDVIDEGFDLALRIGQLKNSSMIAKKITPIKLVLCAAPDYLTRYGIPKHPDELIAAHFLRYSYMEYQQSDSPLIETLRITSQKQNAAWSSNNGEILMAAAIAGEGYVLQPSFIVGEALKQGKLVRILKDYEPEPRGLYAVYPHRKLLAPKLRAFIDFISDYYTQAPYWDDFE